MNEDLAWPVAWMAASIVAIGWGIYNGRNGRRERLDHMLMIAALVCLMGWGLVALPRIMKIVDNNRNANKPVGIHTVECFDKCKHALKQ